MNNRSMVHTHALLNIRILEVSVQEIRSVAILGAGAMGAYLAALFHAVPDFSVSVVAGGERGEKLRNNGLVVNGSRIAIAVSDPDAVRSSADLVIVALKHAHLRNALPELRKLVGPDTVIVSVMNGLDSEEIIGSVYGKEKVLLCVALGMDALRRGDEVIVANIGKLRIGEESNSPVSPRVQRVQRAFEKAGMPCEVPADMIREMWWKFMVNVGVNQAAAVMRVPFGVFQADPGARYVMQALMREVIALAQNRGVSLGEEDLETWDTVLNALSPEGKPSMLQDREAGRPTEVDVFAAKVVSLGKSCGIPTPVNETVLHIVRTLEKYPSLSHR